MSTETEPTQPPSDTPVTPSAPPSAEIQPTTALATVPDARRADGKFAKGNQVRRTHGARVRRPLVDLENTETYRDIINHVGDDPTATERLLARQGANAQAVCDTCIHYLAATRESLSSRRVQSVLATLATHSATVTRVVALLGLKRRTRAIDPLEAIRRRVEAANRKAE